jgi:hypothetical protein
MRLGSGPSWQINTSDPFDLFFALYVRDTAGLAGADDVPSLTPPVPAWSPAHPDSQKAALTEQWRTCWSSLVADPRDERDRGGLDPPDFSATVAAPELRAAQQAVFSVACTWRSENRFDARHSDAAAAMMPTHLVAELEREAGRQAPPFAYSADVVPVDGRWFLDLSPTWLLLSENLHSDTESFRDVLRPRLLALMDS